MPGDTVDVSSAEPSRALLPGEKETYLFQSAGFYSALRPEYKKAAGNWTEKLSEEAKEQNKKVKIVLLIVAVLAVAGLSAFFLGKQWFASSYFNQAQVAFLKGDFDAAKGLFEKSLKFNAKNPEPHFYLAEIALGKTVSSGPLLYPNADYGSAVRHFEQSLSLGLAQKNKDAYWQVLKDAGFSYYMLKQYEKSVPLFLKYIELNPT